MTANTDATCLREAESAHRSTSPFGGPERREGVNQMADKKVSPKAPAEKSKKDTSTKAATRVSKVKSKVKSK